MRAELESGVGYTPAVLGRAGGAGLLGPRDVDIVHAHMTAAETAAWLARPFRRAPIVATRHFADTRGSSLPARLVAARVARSLALDIAISRFVASGIAGPSVLLPNGVPDRDQAPLEAPTVVMLQRLTDEKAPGVGIRAWAAERPRGPGLAPRRRRDAATCAPVSSGRPTTSASPAPSSSWDRSPTPTGSSAGPPCCWHRRRPSPSGCRWWRRWPTASRWWRPPVGPTSRRSATTACCSPPVTPSPRPGPWSTWPPIASRRLEVGAALRRRQRDLFTLAGHVDRLEGLYRQVITGIRGVSAARR